MLKDRHSQHTWCILNISPELEISWYCKLYCSREHQSVIKTHRLEENHFWTLRNLSSTRLVPSTSLQHSSLTLFHSSTTFLQCFSPILQHFSATLAKHSGTDASKHHTKLRFHCNLSNGFVVLQCNIRTKCCACHAFCNTTKGKKSDKFFAPGTKVKSQLVEKTETYLTPATKSNIPARVATINFSKCWRHSNDIFKSQSANRCKHLAPAAKSTKTATPYNLEHTGRDA